MLKCTKVLDDLIISLKADFTKYKKRIPSSRIPEVFDSIIQQSGERFAYTKIATESNIKQIKQAVDLLIMAGLVIPVTHRSANGIPLGTETNQKKKKMLLLDTGIYQRILELNISELLFSDDFNVINKSEIAEILVGLELTKSNSYYCNDDLYFWQREALNSNAEVDYVIQRYNLILPIEVKSGKSGSMQSLHIFMKEKKPQYGIRCFAENFSEYESIKVIPLYAIPNISSL